MNNIIRHFIIKHFYTLDTLFNRLMNDEIDRVRYFINYLQKYDSDRLQELLVAQDTVCGLTILGYALANLQKDKCCEAAIILLEAGAKPHAKFGSIIEGKIAMHRAIEDRLLHIIRLLIWYDPNNYQNIVYPYKSLTTQQMLAEWNRFESNYAIYVDGRNPDEVAENCIDIEKAVYLTENLVRIRLELEKKAKESMHEKNYAEAIKHYQALNHLCQVNAKTEEQIPYPRGYEKNRASLIKLYQDYGYWYLELAYQACEEWVAPFKEVDRVLTNSEMADYKKALECAIQLCQQLKKNKTEKYYLQQLEKLNTRFLTPTTTCIIPSIVTDCRTTSAIQAESSLDFEDPLPYVNELDR